MILEIFMKSSYEKKKEANIKNLLDFHGKYGIDLDKHDEASKGLQPYHFNLQEIQAIFSKINQMTAVDDDVDWALTQLEHYVDGYHRSGEVRVN